MSEPTAAEINWQRKLTRAMLDANEADAHIAFRAREALEELSDILDFQLPTEEAKRFPNLRYLRVALLREEADNE